MVDGLKIAVSFWDVLTDLGHGIAWTRALYMAWYGACSESTTATSADTPSVSAINQSGMCLCSFCFRGTCEMIETLVTSGSASAHSRYRGGVTRCVPLAIWSPHWLTVGRSAQCIRHRLPPYLCSRPFSDSCKGVYETKRV
jgi:hypothetical protein